MSEAKHSPTHLTEIVTPMLAALGEGDPNAASQLLPILYQQLRGIAEAYFRRQRPDHTLQPTALVHEAFMKLAELDNPAWTDRSHFFAVAATAMRQILTDHARRQHAEKRGGDWQRVTLDAAVCPTDDAQVDLLALDEALTRLGNLDERQARIVELRFFAGLTVEETARILKISPRTVELDWRLARAWLRRELAA